MGQIKEQLENEYNKLDDSNLNATSKVNLLNNIIQVKIDNLSYRNVRNDLSIDIKMFLSAIIDLAEYGPHKYDTINDESIMLIFNSLKDDQEKLYYIEYFIRQLQKSSFEIEIKKYQKIKIKTIIKISKKKIWHPKSIFDILLYYPAYNILNLCITLFLIAVILSIITLPAPFEIMGMLNYKIEYFALSNTFLYNHFLNVISSLIGVNDEFKVVPLDCSSMIILIFGKIFMYIYVIVYIFNKLTDYLKR